MAITHSTTADDNADPVVDDVAWNAAHNIDMGLLSDIRSTGPVALIGTSGRLADAATVYPNPSLPAFVGGRWYGPNGIYASSALVSQRLYARPFLVGGATTFDRIGCYIKTAGGYGSLVNLAIYTDDGGKPGALVLSTGAQDATATGPVTGAFDQEFADVIWLAVVGDAGDVATWEIDDGVGDASGGTFTLTVLGQTTAGLAWNITAANLKTAIEGLSSVGAGNVHAITSGGSVNIGDGYQIQFTDGFTVTSGDVSINTASLTGPSSPYSAPDSTVVHFSGTPSLLTDTTSHLDLIGLPDPLVDNDFGQGYSQDSIAADSLPDPWGSTLSVAHGPLIYLRVKP